MSQTTRVYRMRSSQRVITIILLVAGIVFTSAIWAGTLTGQRDPKFFELFFPVVYSLFAAVMMVRAFRNAVLLSSTSIELRTLRGSRQLSFDQIKGRRRYLDRGGDESPNIWHLVIESNDDRFPKLDIEELYRFDETFYAWSKALPDLDELDKTQPKTSNFGLI